MVNAWKASESYDCGRRQQSGESEKSFCYQTNIVCNYVFILQLCRVYDDVLVGLLLPSPPPLAQEMGLLAQKLYLLRQHVLETEYLV